jgi:hypothetical protein
MKKFLFILVLFFANFSAYAVGPAIAGGLLALPLFGGVASGGKAELSALNRAELLVDFLKVFLLFLVLAALIFVIFQSICFICRLIRMSVGSKVMTVLSQLCSEVAMQKSGVTIQSSKADLVSDLISFSKLRRFAWYISPNSRDLFVKALMLVKTDKISLTEQYFLLDHWCRKFGLLFPR